MKNLGLVVAAVAILAAGLATAGLRPAFGQQADHRVTICHKVQGNGNTGNGYDIITVDKDSIVNKDGQIVPNGHGTHSEDAIPAFPAGSQGNSEWGAFAGQGNPEIIDNNCAPVTTTTTSTTVPPTTTTTTTTATTTTTPTEPPPTQPPPTTTVEPPTTTTTTSPPETQTTTTEETTTEQETTTAPPEPTPPPKRPKPPKKSSPPAKPKPPPACPPGESFDGKCGVQGNG